jgi:hypothetical protein
MIKFCASHLKETVLYHAMKAQGQSESGWVITQYFNIGASQWWLFNATPRQPVLTSTEKLAPTVGFETRTMQQVASRYTNCAVPVFKVDAGNVFFWFTDTRHIQWTWCLQHVVKFKKLSEPATGIQ